MPIELNLFAIWNALGAVDEIEEIPIISASFNIFQSGSEMSSINAFEL
jgi:hypothetical protein